jgi:hypothetical protein
MPAHMFHIVQIEHRKDHENIILFYMWKALDSFAGKVKHIAPEE